MLSLVFVLNQPLHIAFNARGHWRAPSHWMNDAVDFDRHIDCTYCDQWGQERNIVTVDVPDFAHRVGDDENNALLYTAAGVTRVSVDFRMERSASHQIATADTNLATAPVALTIERRVARAEVFMRK